MPRLVEMQEDSGEDGLDVVGVTDASRDRARAFHLDRGLNFALVAEAPATREAHGIGLIWGSVVYLVDPEGTIVGEGLDAAEQRLASELWGRTERRLTPRR